MPYEIISGWQRPEAPMPRGWYRHQSGRLHYWDGHVWAGSQATALAGGTSVDAEVSPAGSVSGPASVWGKVMMVLGWMAAILSLGSLLFSVDLPGTRCGMVLKPVVGFEGQSGIACAAALESRAMTAVLLVAVAAFCFLAPRGYRRLQAWITAVGAHAVTV